jgi:hypothetical protein
MHSPGFSRGPYLIDPKRSGLSEHGVHHFHSLLAKAYWEHDRGYATVHKKLAWLGQSGSLESRSDTVTRQALAVVSYQGRAPTTAGLQRLCADAL